MAQELSGNGLSGGGMNTSAANAVLPTAPNNLLANPIGANISTSGTLATTNTTASTSSTTGALTVGGGLGVGGALYTNNLASISGNLLEGNIGGIYPAITTTSWAITDNFEVGQHDVDFWNLDNMAIGTSFRWFQLIGTNAATNVAYLTQNGAFNVATSFQILGDTILTRQAAAHWQLGAADAAAPVAQTLGAQNVVAGTSNTAGANLTIAGSVGTGNAGGGSLIFQTAAIGANGTAQDTLMTALTIDNTQKATFAAGGDFVGAVRDSHGYTVASLPAHVAGQRAYVTDQMTACPAFGSTFTGGGTIICPAFDNGTTWISE